MCTVGWTSLVYLCMYVCMYDVCRKCVTLKNAIIVRPTHTLRVGPPGIVCAKCAHVCHCTRGCGGRRVTLTNSSSDHTQT